MSVFNVKLTNFVYFKTSASFKVYDKYNVTTFLAAKLHDLGMGSFLAYEMSGGNRNLPHIEGIYLVIRSNPLDTLIKGKILAKNTVMITSIFVIYHYECR